MKILTCIIGLLIVTIGNALAQSNDTNDSLPTNEKVIVETFPEFPGGEGKLINYLQTNRIYENKIDSKSKNQIGTTIVSFVIKSDGSIGDTVNIIKPLTPYYDNEAIRLIKSMPNWTPGTQKGKPVNVQYNLPIRF